ncbi:hypothetical protein Plhal703r1_c25g0104921 [Plasmopara halstedii]
MQPQSERPSSGVYCGVVLPEVRLYQLRSNCIVSTGVVVFAKSLPSTKCRANRLTFITRVASAAIARVLFLSETAIINIISVDIKDNIEL